MVDMADISSPGDLSLTVTAGEVTIIGSSHSAEDLSGLRRSEMNPVRKEWKTGEA